MGLRCRSLSLAVACVLSPSSDQPPSRPADSLNLTPPIMPRAQDVGVQMEIGVPNEAGLVTLIRLPGVHAQAVGIQVAATHHQSTLSPLKQVLHTRLNGHQPVARADFNNALPTHEPQAGEGFGSVLMRAARQPGRGDPWHLVAGCAPARLAGLLCAVAVTVLLSQVVYLWNAGECMLTESLPQPVGCARVVQLRLVMLLAMLLTVACTQQHAVPELQKPCILMLGRHRKAATTEVAHDAHVAHE